MYNNKYKLVGICNPFDIVPFLIKPVFEDMDGNLYLSYIADIKTKEYSPYIQGFTRMSNEYMKYVKRLSDCMINSDALDKEYYSINDLAPCGIELNNNIVYIGQMDKYLEFLQEYKNEVAFSFDFEAQTIRMLEDEIRFIEPLVNKYKEDNKKESLDIDDFEKRLIKQIGEDGKDK